MVDEILTEFLIESHEGLDGIEGDLVALERQPNDAERLGNIFRAFHSIKGMCGFLGLTRLEQLAHAAESLLTRLRANELQLTPPRAEVLLAVVDAAATILRAVEQTGTECEAGEAALIASLKTFVGAPSEPQRGADEANGSDQTAGRQEGAPVPDSSVPDSSVPDNSVPDSSVPDSSVPDSSVPDSSVPDSSVPDNVDLFGPPPGPVERLTVVDSGDPTAARGLLDVGDAPRATSAAQGLQGVSAADRPKPPAAPPVGPPGARPESGAPGRSSGARTTELAESTVRVHVTLLDKLMNLVGELVLARNQLVQTASSLEETPYGSTLQRLDLVTTELQEGVMKTRMQQIDSVWRKLPRIARDVAAETRKRARLEFSGRETELDRTLIEAIRDPLTHIVRNSVDHGLEPPAERRSRGKPEEGVVRLCAYQEGGQVVIEISDDGRGIDVEQIRRKAVKSGLLDAREAPAHSEREILQLIFHAGLSTAAKTTRHSGRGVGMDVVKTNIEGIGGTIDIASEWGRGTTIRLRIPLTLAIVPALIVTCQEHVFAIPQVSLVELVRIDDPQQRIEWIGGAPVYRLRERLLPLVRLDEVLGLGKAAPHDTTTYMVVVQAFERRLGIIVDEVCDTEEIVVKALGSQLSGIDVYGGATIRGDGRVALILDVQGIAQRSGVAQDTTERARSGTGSPTGQRGEDSETYLVCTSPDDGRLAIPVTRVERLEETRRADWQRAGRCWFLPYRGDLLPILSIDQVLEERRVVPRTEDAATSEIAPVVVCSFAGGAIGLAIPAVLDIVDEPLSSGRPGTRSGIARVGVLCGRVTEVLDLEYLARIAQDRFGIVLGEEAA